MEIEAGEEWSGRKGLSNGREHWGRARSAPLPAADDPRPTASLVAVLAGVPVGRLSLRAREICSSGGLARISRLCPERLRAELGLGAGPSRRLGAAFALGRRVELERWQESESIRAPEAVHRLMAPCLRGLEQESFHVLLLDGKHRLSAIRLVSVGTLTSSPVHPREVFAPALLERAAAVVCVHNHPSGDPEPSPEDLAVTRRLGESGRLLGVPLLDHVIVAGSRYLSIRERMDW